MRTSQIGKLSPIIELSPGSPPVRSPFRRNSTVFAPPDQRRQSLTLGINIPVNERPARDAPIENERPIEEIKEKPFTITARRRTIVFEESPPPPTASPKPQPKMKRHRLSLPSQNMELINPSNCNWHKPNANPPVTRTSRRSSFSVKDHMASTPHKANFSRRNSFLPLTKSRINTTKTPTTSFKRDDLPKKPLHAPENEYRSSLPSYARPTQASMQRFAEIKRKKL